jgi:hypothetical protein
VFVDQVAMASADHCFDLTDLDLPFTTTPTSLDTDTDGGSFPDLPITLSELKFDLQMNGLMSLARVIWWPILPEVVDTEFISIYPKMKENSMKRYVWVRKRAMSSDAPDLASPTPSTALTGIGFVGPGLPSTILHLPTAAAAASSSSLSFSSPPLTLLEVHQQRQHEILSLLSEVTDFEFILLRQLVDLILRVIPSNDLCFHLFCTLLLKKGFWIAMNYNEHQLTLQLFYELMRGYLTLDPPSSSLSQSSSGSRGGSDDDDLVSVGYEQLVSYRILDDVFLNHLFLNFFVTLLPLKHVLRIIDMFLLEGKIVLHRFGMALIYHFFFLLHERHSGDTHYRFRSLLSLSLSLSLLSPAFPPRQEWQSLLV